jgi:hypothetical protein
MKYVIFALPLVAACSPAAVSKVALGGACKQTSDCVAGTDCINGACQTVANADASPAITSITGNSVAQAGRIETGLIISGANLASVTAARLLSSTGTVIGDLLIGSASASTLTAIIPSTVASVIEGSPGATVTLELQSPNGAARQAVQILRGEDGASGSAGATGATGATGAPGATGAAVPPAPPARRGRE